MTTKNVASTGAGANGAGTAGAAAEPDHGASGDAASDDPTRQGKSFRLHLSRAMLLVLLIAIAPSIMAVRYVADLEREVAAHAPVAEVAGDATSGLEGFLRSAKATRNMITFTLLAAVAAGIVVFYTPVALLKTLGRITTILRQAESGNLNVATAYSRVREVDLLAAAVNRTLGRLRHFDGLKSQRIREEQRLIEALFLQRGDAIALVSPQAKIVRRNHAFRELVARGEGDPSGRSVRDVFGDDVHDAVRRVQRDRDVEMVHWSAGESDPTCRLTMCPVKDEVDAPPRILLTCEPRVSAGGGEGAGG